MITEAQFFEIAKFIRDTKVKYSNNIYVTGADVAGYMSELAKSIQHEWKGCQAGLSVLGIGSDGTIRGCLSQQLDKFIEGNIRERSLIDIWNDENSFYYNRKFSCSMLTGYCKECEYASTCKGGCSRSSSTEGEHCRCNPYCLHKIEKEGFSNIMQARTKFEQDEIAEMYNPIRELPNEFYEKYRP